jgi:hypothetical protein
MTETYYPPRARWYSGLWRAWYLVKQGLHLDRWLKVPQDGFYRSLLGLVLPGWALVWSKRRWLGVVLGTAYCAAAAVFFVWLGHPVSSFAMMVMISIHAGSILRIQQDIEFVKRVVYSLLVFLAVAVLIYMPLRGWMERHWFVPLTVNGRVIVIHSGQRPRSVQRGDWIAYRLGSAHALGVIVREGYTLGRVLAVAGDEVSFGRQEFFVNGMSQARQSDMPTNGTVVVQQGCWFIWPNVRASGHGDASADAVRDAMMQLAIVPETSYVGVPFRRWLWRRQTMP